MDWATYIRRLRRGRGLSLAAFGALLGVGQSTVWRWEDGTAAPQPKHHDALRRLIRLPDTAADRTAIDASRSSPRVTALTDYDKDRYITLSDGTCVLQAAPLASLMAVPRSRSVSEDARRLLADSAVIGALFTGEVAAIRVLNMVPSFHGGPGFALETIWTPLILSDGVRAIRTDARRAAEPLRPAVEALTLEDLAEQPLRAMA